jgi:hypothetical protein
MKKNMFSIFTAFLILISFQLACSLFQKEQVNEAPQQQPTKASLPQATWTTASHQDGNCPALTAVQTSSSGLVSDIVIAKNVEETTMAPVEPTLLYGQQDIFHAVVQIENAPANSKIKVVWYATDVGQAAPCNTRIDAHEISADGTRYIDFNLTPETTWPPGKYRAEITFNDILEQVIDFSVQ